MFNFTTQTILNNVVVQAKGSAKVAGANVFTASGEKPQIRIGNIRFDGGDDLNIESIEVKNPTPEALASVTFDFAKVLNLVQTGSTSTTIEELEEEEKTALDTIDGTYRFVFYIGLSMNSQDAFYSNDFVYKGKPLFIEFPVKKDDEPSDIVKRIAAIAKKYQLMVSQEKVLDITTDTSTTGTGNDAVTAGTITFTGINGYQQIRKVVLQKFDPDANKIDCCSTTGDFVDLMYGVPVIYTTDAGVVTTTEEKLGEDGEGVALADNEVAIAPGLEAFCDYNWIMHNLRLPTAANTNFWSFTKQQGELPAVGQVYTQFIIRMCKNRDGIAGGVVGQRATSVTTHVFYVAGECAKKANTTTTPADKLYKELSTLVGNKIQIESTADSALAAPFA